MKDTKIGQISPIVTEKALFLGKYREVWPAIQEIDDGEAARIAIDNELKHEKGGIESASIIIDDIIRLAAREKKQVGYLKSKDTLGNDGALSFSDKGKIADVAELAGDVEASIETDLMTLEEINEVLGFINDEGDAPQQKADIIYEKAAEISTSTDVGEWRSRKLFNEDGEEVAVVREFTPRYTPQELADAEDLVDAYLAGDESSGLSLSRAAMRGAAQVEYEGDDPGWDFNGDGDDDETYVFPDRQESSVADAVYTEDEQEKFAELCGASDPQTVLLQEFVKANISPNWQKTPKRVLLEGVGILQIIAENPKKYEIVDDIIHNKNGELRSEEDKSYLISRAEFDGLMSDIMKVMGIRKSPHWKDPKKRLAHVEKIGDIIREAEFDEQRNRELLVHQASLLGSIDNYIEGSSKFNYSVERTEEYEAAGGRPETRTVDRPKVWKRHGGLQEVIYLNDEREKRYREQQNQALMLETKTESNDVEE
jgi:hypothetical protein